MFSNIFYAIFGKYIIKIQEHFFKKEKCKSSQNSEQKTKQIEKSKLMLLRYLYLPNIFAYFAIKILNLFYLKIGHL